MLILCFRFLVNSKFTVRRYNRSGVPQSMLFQIPNCTKPLSPVVVLARRNINKLSNKIMKTQKITLINQELKKEFARVGSQEDVSDPIIIAKFFSPSAAGTWYAISYEESSNTCFGYVTDFGYDALGYFSIDELESLFIPSFGVRIERDMYFSPCLLSEITGKPS